jgi:OOP family OmpA-OmpF porin
VLLQQLRKATYRQASRAESVMRYLKQHGVTNSMTAKGYGKDRPIADNKTADGRLQNRRVSLKIVGLQ